MYTVHTRLFKLCVGGDLWDARERLRYGAPAFGLFGRLLDPRLIEARHPPLHLELHLGDLGCPVHHFQGARGGGLHPGHGLPGFLEAGRQGHAETGGVGRGNQLFGVRAFLPLEPTRERVRTVERAAAGLEVPLPVLELAFPDRHRLTRGHRPDSAEGESRKSGGTAQGTLRLGRASPATERTTDDGHEEREEKEDRKSTRLNSSHLVISYAVFCLKKKKNYIE